MIDSEKLTSFLFAQMIRHEMNLAYLIGQMASLMTEREPGLSFEEAIEIMKTGINDLGRGLLPLSLDGIAKDLGLPPGSISVSWLEPGVEFEAWIKKHDFHPGPPGEQA